MTIPPVPPQPPYHVAVLTTWANESGGAEYAATNARLEELIEQQDGYLGGYSAKGEDGRTVTVLYFADGDAVLAWKEQAEHRVAQEKGIGEWFDGYDVVVAKVERAYGFRR